MDEKREKLSTHISEQHPFRAYTPDIMGITPLDYTL